MGLAGATGRLEDVRVFVLRFRAKYAAAADPMINPPITWSVFSRRSLNPGGGEGTRATSPRLVATARETPDFVTGDESCMARTVETVRTDRRR